MSTKKQLERIKRISIPILKKNGVDKAGIFGSYARGEAKKSSDIDLLIKCQRKPPTTGDRLRAQHQWHARFARGGFLTLLIPTKYYWMFTTREHTSGISRLKVEKVCLI